MVIASDSESNQDFWELDAMLVNQTTNLGTPAPNQVKEFTLGKVRLSDIS